jgi:hypothetical protein
LIQRQIEWVDPQKNQNLRAQLWPALRSDSPQTSGEVLALLSWQGEGRKMMAAVSGSDHKAFASAAWVKSDYWIEQEQQWRAISAKVDDGPGADRPPGVLRSSKRRAPIEISQWQVQRAFD